MQQSALDCDVLVVGAGIAGLTVAWQAARRGLRVRVVDAAGPTGGATWASGGMLAPHAEALTGRLLQTAEEALVGYKAFLDELAMDSGRQVHHGFGLRILTAEDDPIDWLTKYASARAAAGRALEIGPADTDGFQGVIEWPENGYVDPRGLVQALIIALERHGATLQWPQAVRAIAETEHSVDVSCTGAQITCGFVVLAAGAHTGAIRGIQWAPGTQFFGDRGLLVRVHGCPTPDTVLFRHQVDAITYVVPDPHGVRVGSTSTPHDLRTFADPSEVAALMARAVRLWPALSRGRVAEVSVGHRPVGPGPEDEPLAGPIPGHLRIFGLLGLHRNGILLAPTLADKIVGRLLAGPATARP